MIFAKRKAYKSTPGRVFCGFTLAEVLITLGVIGVVAAMTIPTLISEYKKRTVIEQLKGFYSTFSQAIKLSEIENGAISSWTFAGYYSSADNMTFFNTYLKDYFSYSNVENYNSSLPANGILVYLNNGTAFHLAGDLVVFYLHPHWGNQIDGRDIFYFYLGSTVGSKSITPYAGTLQPRSFYLQNLTSHCGYSLNSNRRDCAALIMKDNWQILDDYPVKF